MSQEQTPKPRDGDPRAVFPWDEGYRGDDPQDSHRLLAYVTVGTIASNHDQQIEFDDDRKGEPLWDDLTPEQREEIIDHVVAWGWKQLHEDGICQAIDQALGRNR